MMMKNEIEGQKSLRVKASSFKSYKGKETKDIKARN